MNIQLADFQLQDVDFSNELPVITAKSITKDFVCEAGLSRLARDSVGKPLVWRHEHPIEIASNHIYGKVIEAIAEDGYLLSKYQVYNHTNDHKKLIDILKRRNEIEKPLSISLRFRTYFNEENKPVHYDVFEHSITPTPACKECKIIDFKNEDINMSEIDEKLNEIKKLEDELTKKDKILEDLEKTVEELKKDISVKDESLEETKDQNTKLTEQILEFKDKIMEQERKIELINEQRELDKLMPLVDELVLEDGEDMKDLYLAKAKNKEIKFDEKKKFFEKRLEEVKSRIVAEVKTLDESLEESFDESELEMSEEEYKKKAKKALKHNPELYKKLYGDK